MKHIIEVVGDALIIVCGAWVLVTLALIWTQGFAWFYEPDKAILTGELIASALIIPFGLYLLVDGLKAPHLLELLGDVIIIGFGCFSFYMFAMFWEWGSLFLQANTAWLIVWAVVAGIIELVGLERLINDIW